METQDIDGRDAATWLRPLEVDDMPIRAVGLALPERVDLRLGWGKGRVGQACKTNGLNMAEPAAPKWLNRQLQRG